jgi:FkbM family methyltransferase
MKMYMNIGKIAISHFLQIVKHPSLYKIAILVKLSVFWIISKKSYFSMGQFEFHAPNKSMLFIRIIDNILGYDEYFTKIPSQDIKTILDLGSNIGYSTLYFRSRYPDSQIFAFDPVDEVNKYFLMNMKANNIKNIKKFDVALSDHEGDSVIYIEPNRLNMNSLDPKFQCTVEQKVSLRKLTNIINEERIENIDILKIDVEGAEGAILHDLISAQYLSRVKNILVEIRKDNYSYIEQLDTDFNRISISKVVNPYDEFEYMIYFGVHK